MGINYKGLMSNIATNAGLVRLPRIYKKASNNTLTLEQNFDEEVQCPDGFFKHPVTGECLPPCEAGFVRNPVTFVCEPQPVSAYWKYSPPDVTELKARFAATTTFPDDNNRINTKRNAARAFIRNRANMLTSANANKWVGPLLVNTTPPAPAHSSSNTYNAGTWVSSGGRGYQAKINVPSGIAISNTTYWNTYGRQHKSNLGVEKGERVYVIYTSGVTVDNTDTPPTAQMTVWDAWKDIPAGLTAPSSGRVDGDRERSHDRGYFIIPWGSGRIRGTNYNNKPLGNVMVGAQSPIWDLNDPRAGDNDAPHESNIQTANLAFRIAFDESLTGADRTSAIAKVTEVLMWYATGTGHTLKWNDNNIWRAGDSNDINPLFLIAPAVMAAWDSYELNYGNMTDSQKEACDTWFFNFANFAQPEGNNSFDSLFGGRTNRVNRTWTVSAGARDTTTVASERYTHKNGYPIFGYMKYMNNRREILCVVPGEICLVFKYRGHKIKLSETGRTGASNSADLTTAQLNARINEIVDITRMCIEEYIALGCQADGTPQEFYRGSSGEPEEGYQYQVDLFTPMVRYVYQEMKLGVRHFADFVTYRNPNYTTNGSGMDIVDIPFATTSTPKTFYTLLHAMCRYVARDWPTTRYRSGASSEEGEIIDGLDPDGTEAPGDIMAVKIDAYYKNVPGTTPYDKNYLSSVYKRSRPGIRAFAPFKNFGQYNAHTGGFGFFVYNQYFFVDMPAITLPASSALPVIPD